MARKTSTQTDGSTTAAPPDPTKPHPKTRKIQLATLSLSKLAGPLGKSISRAVEAAIVLRTMSGETPDDYDRSCLFLGKQARESLSDLESLASQVRRLAEMLPKA